MTKESERVSEESPSRPQYTRDPEKGRVGGALVVVVLLLVIAAGTALWFSFDFDRDVLDKKTGGRFSAAFEKECQPLHGAEFCKGVAGEHHALCLRGSASKAESGIAYDREAYLTCMRHALDSVTGEP